MTTSRSGRTGIRSDVGMLSLSRTKVGVKSCLSFLLAPDRRDLEQRLGAVGDARFGDLHLDHILSAGKVEHHFHENLFQDRAQAARTGAALQGLAGDCDEGSFVEGDLHVLEAEELRVLLGEGVLRLLEDAHQRLFVETFQRDGDRKASHQLWNQSIAEEIVRLDFAEHLGLRKLLVARSGAVEANLAASGAGLVDFLEPVERATADEENVLGVELDVLLLRVLATALGRNGGDGALDDLEQCLLHSFTRHVAGYARVLRFPRDLVDFVDVDDSALALGDVEITGLEEANQNVLDVFADVAGFRESGSVRDGERRVENAG